MTDSPIARSIRARLLNMSNGDNKRFQQLVVRFFHERLLFRLSQSNYRNSFILKGGTLLYAFEEFTPRPTLDIDFMGMHVNNDKDSILNVFKSIASSAGVDDGICFLTNTFTAQDITLDKKYPGVRVSMEGTLGPFRQKLTLDIGFGDVIVPHAMLLEYPTLFDSMEEPKIMAYSLETVVAEKFQTMIARGRFNSRMKDFFDLYRIFKVHKFDSELLERAIAATFRNRGTQFVDQHDFFCKEFRDDIQINQQWDNYLKKMHLELTSFEIVHRFITDMLFPYWIQLRNNTIA